MDFKEKITNKAAKTTTVENAPAVKKSTNVLKSSMSIAEIIKAIEPEIKRALPAVITPERFTRMALNAISNTPALNKCTPMSFIAALMNAAQLGLEPNTPLGQAYLIPYNNKKKGVTECQFQIGYKGMIDLVYRNENVQTIQAQVVYENDAFEYELGINSKLRHIPAMNDRGEMIYVYALFKLQNGGYGFEVMNRESVIAHAERYSKSFDSYSPWKTDFEAMAKKTVIKKLLKFAPLKADFQRAIATDETIKNELAVDMTELNGEDYYDLDEANEGTLIPDTQFAM